MDSPIILLASNSPRRRQLLSITGWSFNTIPVEIDETPRQGESAECYVLRLAETKASAAVTHASRRTIILAADTTVALDDSLLGKPVDSVDATAMLERLRGRMHQVYTALAIYNCEQDQLLTDVCVSGVQMRRYTDSEIRAYVDSGDPLDKAGAYAIQHSKFHPVERINDCFACVTGLPLCNLLRIMREFGFVPQLDVPRACQEKMSYKCTIFPEMLGYEQVDY